MKASDKKRVLVVDDNPDAANSLELVVRKAGYDVKVARDGLEGLALAASFQPHAVLLDIGLPSMDGFEVARQLRRQPGLERVSIIAVTGYGGERERRLSREAGFDHYLVKPIDYDELRRLLALKDTERK